MLDEIRGWWIQRPRLLYARGCDVNSIDESGFAEAIQTAKKADQIILVLGGKSGLAPDCTTGEFRDTTDLGLPGVQEKLSAANHGSGETGRVGALEWTSGIHSDSGGDELRLFSKPGFPAKKVPEQSQRRSLEKSTQVENYQSLSHDQPDRCQCSTITNPPECARIFTEIITTNR